jgi:hypothetical protein
VLGIVFKAERTVGVAGCHLLEPVISMSDQRFLIAATAAPGELDGL